MTGTSPSFALLGKVLPLLPRSSFAVSIPLQYLNQIHTAATVLILLLLFSGRSDKAAADGGPGPKRAQALGRQRRIQAGVRQALRRVARNI